MYAAEQEYDETLMHGASWMFQNTMMSTVPLLYRVVVAPHGLTLGGSMRDAPHSDKVQRAAAEKSYIGLAFEFKRWA